MNVYFFYAGEETLLPRQTAIQTLAGLLASDCRPHLLGDLCRLAISGVETLEKISRDREGRIISEYQPRAVGVLFAYAGLEGPDPEKIISHSGMCSCGVLSAVFGREAHPSGEDLKEAGKQLDSLERDNRSGWRPWYPVIDRERCKSCGQCAGFCLFEVYEVPEDGRIAVKNPGKCKDNCPACARICPEGAIIFPKFPAPPVNGGEGESSEPVRIDPSIFTDGDIMGKLRQRAGKIPADLVEKFRKECDCSEKTEK